MRRLAWSGALLLLLLLATLVWSNRLELGLPRVALSVESPDGRFVAFVRNHPELDPPNQSIWLERVGGGAELIERLGPDQDWCDEVVWSEDSTRVAFVITHARLRVVEAASGGTLFDDWVLESPLRYTPDFRIRDLELTRAGTARFRTCTHDGECSPVRTLDLAVSGGPA